MRLTPEQVLTIKQAALTFFGPGVSVILFGSRTDDRQKGGDIDLYLETDQADVSALVRSEIAFLAEMTTKLGDQKIDLLVDYPARKTRPPIFDIARATGIAL